MQIEKININEIKIYEKNAKVHDPNQVEQIKKSIEKFGNNDPIAIDENNVIIEGHGRFLALKQLNFSEIEVIRLSHLTSEQKKAYILAHNKLTMNTGFDFDILNEELKAIQDINMCDFGFIVPDLKEQIFSDNHEILISEFTDESFELECPRCKFRWNNE